MPTKTTAAPTPAPAPLPPVPVVPVVWTPTTIVGYAASMVTFILGVLTAAGVTLPSGVGTDAQAIAGAAVIIVGAITAAATTVSSHVLAGKQVSAPPVGIRADRVRA